MAGYDFILFDLDGTISDPRPGVYASLQYALHGCDVDEQDTERLAQLIGPPLWQGFIDRYRFSERLAARAYDLYCEHFLAIGAQQYALYPGIEALLASLRAAGKELVVATSRETLIAVQMVERLGLRDYFSRVAGDADADTAPDKAATIRMLLAGRPGDALASSVMVGDLESDVTAAQANGLASIAVAYGLSELAALRQARPTHLVHTVAELQAILTGQPIGGKGPLRMA